MIKIAIASDHAGFRFEEAIIGGRMVGESDAIRIVDAWLDAEFEGGRHLRRIEKIESCGGQDAAANGWGVRR